MAERAADYEWRGEGKEAEVVLYAPDETVAGLSFEHALRAARLPGAISPVYAAAVRPPGPLPLQSLSGTSSGLPGGFGWVAASETHMAPELISVPGWGLLLIAEAPARVLGEPEEVRRLLSRRLSEAAMPEIGEAETRRVAESGALWTAGEGLIEEEDLPFFTGQAGELDSLSRRSLSAGTRDWTRPASVRALQVSRLLDSEAAEALGLDTGALALVLYTGAEDLGRLALLGHSERILARTTSGVFGAPSDLPAVPIGTEEAYDLVAATGTMANYAAGRASLFVYALRGALGEVAGALSLRAGWVIGGIEKQEGRALHHNRFAKVGQGETLVAGNSVAVATGGMLRSAPPFDAPEEDGRWLWEEVGMLVRAAVLEPLGTRSGEVQG